MAIVRWRPMRDMFSLQREIDHMFDDMFGGRFDEDEGTTSLLPVADIVENKDSYAVTAELPGIRKEDIKVTLQNNILTISGEKKKESEKNEKTFHRTERSYGAFFRTFDLPSVVDSSRIKADYRDGILVIELPKVEEAKPKEIPVTVG